MYLISLSLTPDGVVHQRPALLEVWLPQPLLGDDPLGQVLAEGQVHRRAEQVVVAGNI